MARTPTPPRRADAQRNRERILEAAAEALAEDGSTPLHAIGKRAGIGQGTLYRHFPDRDALIWAVSAREVDELASQAGALLAELSPRRALREWLSLLGAFALSRADLGVALSTADGGSRPGYFRVVEAVEQLLAANRAAGTVRGDVTVQDVSDLVAALWRIPPGPERTDRAERLLDLVALAIGTDEHPEKGHGAGSANDDSA